MVFDKVQLILFVAELKVAGTPQLQLPVVYAYATQMKGYDERT
ncbi:hypothetical protein FM107_01680 [Sphingobacterium sp. JB170]|nr:hypothetical protein FM107_01680 [Sphingobacterium sp. JB170]